MSEFPRSADADFIMERVQLSNGECPPLVLNDVVNLYVYHFNVVIGAHMINVLPHKITNKATWNMKEKF